MKKIVCMAVFVLPLSQQEAESFMKAQPYNFMEGKFRYATTPKAGWGFCSRWRCKYGDSP